MLRNDDVSLTSSKYSRYRRVPEKNSRVHSAATLASKSTDLNSVDYSGWSILQEKVYKTRITDLDDFKHRIIIRTEWAKLYHAIIAAAVCQ